MIVGTIAGLPSRLNTHMAVMSAGGREPHRPYQCLGIWYPRQVTVEALEQSVIGSATGKNVYVMPGQQ